MVKLHKTTLKTLQYIDNKYLRYWTIVNSVTGGRKLTAIYFCIHVVFILSVVQMKLFNTSMTVFSNRVVLSKTFKLVETVSSSAVINGGCSLHANKRTGKSLKCP